MAKERDQEFLEYVVGELVTKPEAVKIERSIDEKGVLLELTVDQSDMGVIIGKEGKTAKSIRALLRVLGAKNDSRVNLKIVEPEGSERPQRAERQEEVREESAAEEVSEEKEEIVEEAPVEEEADEEPMADLDL